MVTEFQTAPPQYAPLPQLPKKSLREQIKEHKTIIIVGCVAFFLLIGAGAYLLSPARGTIVAPANTERIATPTLIPSPTVAQSGQFIADTPTLSPLPTPLPATSWQIYTNTTYGYTIKYPPNWTAQNLGVLEPKVPSYINFLPPAATSSARLITISISTRTYAEQLALGSSSSAITVAGIKGTKQYFQDSNDAQSTAIILPRTNNLLILRAKTEALNIFNQMVSTLTSTK